jgi:endonuclease/exonuclease/phosphatase family metal-dependent hydrolase
MPSEGRIRALSWNLHHGRDFPPDPGLLTWRSRLLRINERNATHLQVNRDLLPEFAALLAGASWEVALLQECPPRWTADLARRCAADAHISLTSRNSLPALRAGIARLNPDLIGANEGGSNTTLVRRGRIVEREEVEIRPRPPLRVQPERRTMALTRLDSGLCIANLHASALAPELAESDVLIAAERALEWAGGSALIFGGDLNLRPATSGVFEELERRHGIVGATEPSAIDHILVRGLEILEPAAPWIPERRDVREDGLAIRLSDHAPVELLLSSPSSI